MRNRQVAVVAAFLCAVVCGTAVNFLIKLAPEGEPAVALNGWRTLAAVVLLLPVAAWLRVSLRLPFGEFWRYALVAALTMAAPHALIFFGVRKLGADPATVAFVEAAILGIVVVYLMAGGRRVGAWPLLCTLLALVGLVVFVAVGKNAFTVSAGDGCILAAAVATAGGLIFAEKIRPPSRSAGDAAETTVDRPFLMKLRGSMKKTLVSCFIAGAGTLLAVAGVNLALGAPGPALPLPATASWPWVLALAVVGSCLAWFSTFLLIEFGQLILAAASIAATPVTTVLAEYLWFNQRMTGVPKWIGAIVVLVSLAALIALQLRPTRASAGAVERRHGRPAFDRA